MNQKMNAERFRDSFYMIRKEVKKEIIGMDDIIDFTLLGIIAGGHILLEGVPGIGKTRLIKAISRAIRLNFSRIQFTPDLMPADIIGTNILMEAEGGRKQFFVQKGPIFSNLILADEINRATPKTQSALLEAMQEGQITITGKTYPLPLPFFVAATQNPIEMEGTYPLPEAEIDRFMMKLVIDYPSEDEMKSIVDSTTGIVESQAQGVISGEDIKEMGRVLREVPYSPQVLEYIVKLVQMTHPEIDGTPDLVKRFLRYGSSPRGAQAILLIARGLSLMKGRYNVSLSDVEEACTPCLRHRILLNFEGEAEGIDRDKIISAVIEGGRKWFEKEHGRNLFK